MTLCLTCVATGGNTPAQAGDAILLRFIAQPSSAQDCNLQKELCPLVIEPLWSHDDHKFLANKLTMFKDSCVGSSVDWREAQVAMAHMPASIGCLQISGCGHVFCAAPLLYLFATSSFRCPVCRFGNNAKIDMSGPSPVHMPAGVWTALSIMSKLAGVQQSREQIHDTAHAVDVFALNSFLDLYATIPWQMVVSVYRRANASVGDIPYACVHMNMRHERASAHDSHVSFSAGTVHACCTLLAFVNGHRCACMLHHAGVCNGHRCACMAGHRGPARRLSKLLRECQCFFVEIFVDNNTSRHILYQSTKSSFCQHDPLHTNATTRALTNNIGAVGSCQLIYELCSYDHQAPLRGVLYRVPETQLRAFVVDMSNTSGGTELLPAAIAAGAFLLIVDA